MAPPFARPRGASLAMRNMTGSGAAEVSLGNIVELRSQGYPYKKELPGLTKW